MAKFDVDGTLRWAFHVPYQVNIHSMQGLSGLALAPSQSVYFAGTMTSGAKFAGKSFVSRGHDDVFIGKLSPEGKLLWLAQAGGGTSDCASALTMDDEENVYVTGTFTTESHFGTTTLKTRKGLDIFVSKLTSNGRFVWTIGFGGQAVNNVNGLTLDGQRGLYVVGSFREPLSFGKHMIRPQLILPEQLNFAQPNDPPHIQKFWQEQALKSMFNPDGSPKREAYSLDIYAFHLAFGTNALNGTKPPAR